MIKEHNCCGCGVCAIVCPKNIIDIKKSALGFYVAEKNNHEECINCDLCRKICPLNKDNYSTSKVYGVFSVFSNSNEILETCSSGGVAYEIGKLFLSKGYKICGVKYNYELERAEHCVVDNVNDLEVLKGSKYLQSYTFKALKEIEKEDKVVFFGTPCQVDAVKRWVTLNNMTDNYFLVDIFCHGVPSYLLWEKYLSYQLKKNRVKKFSKIVFRDKKFGWHDSMISLGDGVKKVENRFKRFDLFYSFFLLNLCLNIPCYDCKFRGVSSSADLRIGDFWGEKYKDNKKGVSAVITYNKKASDLINDLRKRCVVIVEDVDSVIGGQPQKIDTPMMRDFVMRDFMNSKKSIYYIAIYSVFPMLVIVFVRHIFKKFKK